MKNIFQNPSDDMNTVSEWIQLKMNNEFKEEINLNDSYTIDKDGSGLVLPTDGESSLNEGQKSYLRTLCNMINRPTIALDQMKEEINSLT
ncbi:hypothetical protein [Chryseobacterium gleum]|uniref:hypothetical protein n=1 Tax=Chryseobacterium gleum TaxID=250 RepID=UPI001E6022FA|nr:hypothetical protein [Chryseobacterium gleum]MCD9616102.1 hypothetical protein [Chryseobacterium gleum]MCE4064288.1 hypothetical protein [Chryseobacterium gleum]